MRYDFTLQQLLNTIPSIEVVNIRVVSERVQYDSRPRTIYNGMVGNLSYITAKDYLSDFVQKISTTPSCQLVIDILHDNYDCYGDCECENKEEKPEQEENIECEETSEDDELLANLEQLKKQCLDLLASITGNN